jgi:hypothetical protein
LGATAALALGLIAGASALPAWAATFNVDCASDSGALTTALSSAGDGDTLSIQGTCKGVYVVAHSLTLVGSSGATLDGQGAGTVLTVNAGTTVSIANLTVTDGFAFVGGGIINQGTLTLTNSSVTASGTSFAGAGGGIVNGGSGTLTLNGSTVRGNSASFGGGIYNFGPLTLNGSIVSGNAGNGGGILNNASGAVTITNSTLSGNSGTSPTNGTGLTNVSGGSVTLDDSNVDGNLGAGISNSGALTVANSTVSRNSGAVGGGIANDGGRLTVTNSTIASNSATGFGGGISNTFNGNASVTGSAISNNTAMSGGGFDNEPSSLLAITNSTITGNTASVSGGGISVTGFSTLTLNYDTITGNRSPVGGGIAVTAVTATVLKGTVVATQANGGNCSGTISDGGYNLDDGTSCGFSSATSSLSNTNPLLDPSGLQDHGGPTKTIALEAGSPAIDAIPAGAIGCGTTVTTDQRGISRPHGPACDMGAYEVVVVDADLALTNVPSNITTNATSPSGAVVNYTNPTVVDEDSPLPTATCMPASGATFPIGTTTVNCSVSAAGDSKSPVTASFTVTVKGAAAQLADLLSAVTGIGPGTSLADKIALAQQYLAANDLADACSTLTAFINEVNAQSGKAIQTDLAGTLTAAAQRIRAVLGC